MAKSDKLKLVVLKIDLELQPRAAGLSAEVVAEYVERIKSGTTFPPLVVYFDAETATYWLSEGFHRAEAYRQAGVKDVPVEMRHGSRAEALLNAMASNQQHGLRRSNADKRRAAEVVLRLYPSWSDGKIATHIGVSQPFVGDIRKVACAESDNSSAQKREGRDGVLRDAPTPKPAPALSSAASGQPPLLIDTIDVDGDDGDDQDDDDAMGAVVAAEGDPDDPDSDPDDSDGDWDQYDDVKFTLTGAPATPPVAPSPTGLPSSPDTSFDFCANQPGGSPGKVGLDQLSDSKTPATPTPPAKPASSSPKVPPAPATSTASSGQAAAARSTPKAPVAASSSVVRDRLGREVPENLQRVFDGTRFQAEEDAYQCAKEALSEARDTSASAVVLDLLKQGRDALQRLVPYCVCPSCGGNSPEGCPTCEGSGWLTYGAWSELPNEMLFEETLAYSKPEERDELPRLTKDVGVAFIPYGPGLDGRGNRIHKGLRDLFRDRTLADLANSLKSVAATAQGCLSWNPWLDLKLIESIEIASEMLANARPFACCPVCQGGGSSCATCQTSGFIPVALQHEIKPQPKAKPQASVKSKQPTQSTKGGQA